MSRAAHRFHRFAHHPLCDEYSGEVVRLGRRARLCRGCLFAWGGGLSGAAAGFAVALPVGAGYALVAFASAFVAISTWFRRGVRRSKIVTRWLPASAMGLATGAGLCAGGAAGLALAGFAMLAVGALAAFYRRRGVDRTPCATCPERLGAAPCRGFVEIVHRERAFRRLATRVLARAAQPS
jgi:uncharacterized membrane protein YfcA